MQELAERRLIDVLLAVAEADVFVDEALIVQALRKDDLGHRVEQQQIGSRDDGQMDVGVLRGLGPPRIDADDHRLRVQPFAAAGCARRSAGDTRMGWRRSRRSTWAKSTSAITSRRFVLAEGLAM